MPEPTRATEDRIATMADLKPGMRVLYKPATAPGPPLPCEVVRKIDGKRDAGIHVEVRFPRAMETDRVKVASLHLPERACRVCGCIEEWGCWSEQFGGGCYWVEADLCSQCVGLVERI